MSGVFPSVLKIQKLALVFKKDSKLDCCNYRPIFLLSNTEKILEKFMYKRLHTITLSITYSLDSDNNIQHLML